MSDRLTNPEKTLRIGPMMTMGHIPDLDPRMRIVLAALFAVVVVSLSDLIALCLAVLVAVTLLPLSSLPAKRTFKRMAAMDGFIIFTLILLPFSVAGTPMFTFLGFDASWEGLRQAVEIALTANAVILALMCLVGSMEPVTMGHALHALRMPEQLVQLLMFTTRYIETLREEYMRLRAAMKMRGFRPGTNWHTYRSFGYLVGMMLVRALERSERVLGAMKCRGFTGRFVLLEQFRMTDRDWLFAALMTAASVLLLVVQFRHAFA
ncbi:MAG: cobalt ECF transporter T component CbiQ [Donghicola eburneus]|jgi:cobalt/nickel transport system permease protein|nr:cobalt ECF transporter T component CbiQ [Donghicola eburneus]MCI5041472.1 cobalt ECF transporter T component CbiQ [Donghicola eburneus]